MIRNCACLARKILNNNTPYSFNKQMIQRVFTEPFREFDQYKRVYLRLTVIDAYYTTNATKHHYNIEEIANSLARYNDDNLKSKFANFISNPTNNHEIFLILDGQYGINQAGPSRCTSLISKYAYFLTDLKFPIYDGNARESLNTLKKAGFFDQIGNNWNNGNNILNFFFNISHVNDQYFNDFDLLDNLLWLIKEVRDGKFHLFLRREQYMNLVNLIGNKIEFHSVLNALNNNQNFFNFMNDELPDLLRFIRFVSTMNINECNGECNDEI